MLERHTLYGIANKNPAQQERCRELGAKSTIALRFIPSAAKAESPWIIALSLWPDSWKVWRRLFWGANVQWNG
jgi:hypothetical protein